MKSIWDLLNRVLKDGHKNISYPDLFSNKEEITNMQGVANKFNDFFVNIGPDLAEKISNCMNDKLDYSLIERNPKNIFLSDVSETEIKKYRY